MSGACIDSPMVNNINNGYNSNNIKQINPTTKQ